LKPWSKNRNQRDFKFRCGDRTLTPEQGNLFLLTPDTRHLKPYLDPFAALRAVFEISIQGFSTTPARPGRIGLLLGRIRPESVAGLRAAVANDKRLAFFDSEHGNKKQAEIVVHALRIRLIQSAYRTPARILVQNLFFGRNAGNEDHGSIWLGVMGKGVLA
jgi:hypothetical protein